MLQTRAQPLHYISLPEEKLVAPAKPAHRSDLLLSEAEQPPVISVDARIAEEQLRRARLNQRSQDTLFNFLVLNQGVDRLPNPHDRAVVLAPLFCRLNDVAAEFGVLGEKLSLVNHHYFQLRNLRRIENHFMHAVKD